MQSRSDFDIKYNEYYKNLCFNTPTGPFAREYFRGSKGVGGSVGGSRRGSVGGSRRGSRGGSRGGSVGGPRGSVGGPRGSVGGPRGGPRGSKLGGPRGGPRGSKLGGPRGSKLGGPRGGPRGSKLGGNGGIQKQPKSPKDPVDILNLLGKGTEKNPGKALEILEKEKIDKEPIIELEPKEVPEDIFDGGDDGRR